MDILLKSLNWITDIKGGIITMYKRDKESVLQPVENGADTREFNLQ